ncbi:hypothetical protein B0H67DRAFT_344490 [Lasiosphaeris hirsuta]|uniref:Uncharacterized protein n=1 Tax=Lasiosphaeris hirsuta TaxID=260670 RepID=A0AA40A3M2_9PEZI|nr:hypothetical protein B0H67DRAFT_344490 [Lasiosphaeris hirsuta]
MKLDTRNSSAYNPTCYWPDGTDATNNLWPCIYTGSPVWSSLCCYPNDLCLRGLLCRKHNSPDWYRGGCKAKTTPSGECSNHCTEPQAPYFDNLGGPVRIGMCGDSDNATLYCDNKKNFASVCDSGGISGPYDDDVWMFDGVYSEFGTALMSGPQTASSASTASEAASVTDVLTTSTVARSTPASTEMTEPAAGSSSTPTATETAASAVFGTNSPRGPGTPEPTSPDQGGDVTSPGKSNDIALGVGVGIGLGGALLAIAILFLVWRKRRGQARWSRAASPKPPARPSRPESLIGVPYASMPYPRTPRA